MDKIQRIVLIVAVIIVIIIVIVAAGITIYYVFFRKKPSFPLPTVLGASTQFATFSGPPQNVAVPNGSNSLFTYTTGGTAIACTPALNENAIGYQVINNSGVAQSCFLNALYYGSTTCSVSQSSLALFVVNPYSTVNWNDKSVGTDTTGALVYPTFYLNCDINFLSTSSTGNVTTTVFLPGGTSDIDINTQYYQITFNSDGTSEGKVVNA